MKLNVIRQTKRRPLFACLLILILLTGTYGYSVAQQIVSVSGSRFKTGASTISVEEGEFGVLSFSSSSYIGGELKIVSSDRANPIITFHKIIKADSKTQAVDFADFIELEIEHLENELAIRAETKSTPPWSGTDYSGRISLLIEVPRNKDLKIVVRGQSYAVAIDGPFAVVEVDNSFGNVDIREINSKIKVVSQNSRIRLLDCEGPTTIRTSTRPIILRNVDSKLGTIKLRNTNGKIELDSVRGEIDARTTFAEIIGEDIVFESGRSKLRTEASNIKLDIAAINGDVFLVGSNGRIDLELPQNTSARYMLEIEEGGRIYTRDLLITTDIIKRTLVSGYSGDKRHKIDVDMRGVGTISLQGKPVDDESI